MQGAAPLKRRSKFLISLDHRICASSILVGRAGRWGAPSGRGSESASCRQLLFCRTPSGIAALVWYPVAAFRYSGTATRPNEQTPRADTGLSFVAAASCAGTGHFVIGCSSRSTGTALCDADPVEPGHEPHGGSVARIDREAAFRRVAVPGVLPGSEARDAGRCRFWWGLPRLPDRRSLSGADSKLGRVGGEEGGLPEGGLTGSCECAGGGRAL